MKKKCFQLLCFLLCLTAIGACEEDPEVLTGNIMGKVTDAATGNVMQGVSVTITPGGLSRTTGTDGYFEFLELEPKQYEIQARKTDYVTNHKTVYVVTGRDASGDIQLTPEVKEAKLALSVSSLNFGKDNTSLSFDIINEGEINFNWNISGLDKIDWLEVNPTSGRLAAGKSNAVQVSLLRDRITENKEATILINADKESVALKITAEAEKKESKITINPHSLHFGEDYSSLTFEIKNDGNVGDEDWNITSIDADWIKVSPITGTTAIGKSSTVKVELDREKLPAGAQTTTILVNYNGGSQRITINATGEERTAKITLSQNTLDFGMEATSLTFDIKNVGNAGDISWEISSINAEWLKVTPTTGTTSMDKSSAVKVEVDREKMAEGKQTTTFLVNAYGESFPITVNAEKEIKVAKITLSQNTLDFGMEATSLTFDIKNVGNAGDINWEISGINAEWLKVTPTTGTTSMDKSSAVKVEVDREKMAEGKQTATFLVNAYGESFPITVNAEKEIKVAKITLSQNTLDFGMEATSLTFDIKNVGNAGDINWEISGINAEWLKVTPTTGTTSMDKSSAVKVEVDREKMAEGKQTTTFLVNAYGESFPITVNAEKEVKVAKITLSQNTLDFGLEATSLTFDIKNVGNAGDISWEISGINAEWLKVTPTTGTTSMDKSSAVKVEVDREKMAEGKQTTTFLVNAYGESFPITVNAEKEVKVAKITLSQNSLDFGLEASSLTFDIKNVGNAGDISWEISGINAEWLKVTPTTGTTSMDKSSAVKVEVDREKMAEEKQTTTFLVNAYGESFPITVNAEKEIKVAKITLSQNSLDFGMEATSLTFDIKNVGNAGDINWEISGVDVSWVKVFPMTGTTSMERSSAVKVEVDREKMSEGKNSTTILVNAYGASFPITIHAEKKPARYIEVIPTAIAMGTDDSAILTLMSHNGATAYELFADGDYSWASFSKTEGVIPEYSSTSANSLENITINANRTGLTAGTYSFTLIIRSDLGDTRVPVSMKVEEAQIPGGGNVEIISCHDDLVFTLTSCKILGTTATISYMVENVGNTSINLMLDGATSGRSYIYDDQGNQYDFGYNTASLTLGTSESYSRVSATIPASVKVKGSIKIYNVSDVASAFSNICIWSYSAQNYLILKNVELEGRSYTPVGNPQTTGSVVSCSDDFEFTLLDCKRGSSNTVTISYRVKNITNQPIKLMLDGATSGRSYIYDDQGNQYDFGYNTASLTLGTSESYSRVSATIPGNVFVNGSIIIKNADAAATEMANITIWSYSHQAHLTLKNVKIRK